MLENFIDEHVGLFFVIALFALVNAIGALAYMSGISKKIRSSPALTVSFKGYPPAQHLGNLRGRLSVPVMMIVLMVPLYIFIGLVMLAVFPPTIPILLTLCLVGIQVWNCSIRVEFYDFGFVYKRLWINRTCLYHQVASIYPLQGGYSGLGSGSVGFNSGPSYQVILYDGSQFKIPCRFCPQAKDLVYWIDPARNPMVANYQLLSPDF